MIKLIKVQLNIKTRGKSKLMRKWHDLADTYDRTLEPVQDRVTICRECTIVIITSVFPNVTSLMTWQLKTTDCLRTVLSFSQNTIFRYGISVLTDLSYLLFQVNICLVGKYTKLDDAYKSVVNALEHASLFVNHKLKLSLVESEDLEVCRTILNYLGNKWKHFV